MSIQTLRKRLHLARVCAAAIRRRQDAYRRPDAIYVELCWPSASLSVVFGAEVANVGMQMSTPNTTAVTVMTREIARVFLGISPNFPSCRECNPVHRIPRKSGMPHACPIQRFVRLIVQRPLITAPSHRHAPSGGSGQGAHTFVVCPERPGQTGLRRPIGLLLMLCDRAEPPLGITATVVAAPFLAALRQATTGAGAATRGMGPCPPAPRRKPLTAQAASGRVPRGTRTRRCRQDAEVVRRPRRAAGGCGADQPGASFAVLPRGDFAVHGLSPPGTGCRSSGTRRGRP